MEKIIIKLLICAFWVLAAISVFGSYKRIIYNYTSGLGRWLVYLWIIAVSPILVLNTLLTTVMDWFLPEGWINGDDEFFNDQEDNDDGTD